jgi:hypothetical protein
MTRLMPAARQNFTAAWFTVLACTERWMAMCGQRSRTMAIRPGSAMISASGASATTGAMSSR